MLSVIIPTYNRRHNLELVLHSLVRQGGFSEAFEVIIVDDGSEDYSLPLVIVPLIEHLRLKYCWHPRAGARLAYSRNEGTHLARGGAFIFLDSDVMLNPTALAHYINLYRANPTCIIAGRYDWLVPMKIETGDLHNRWSDVIAQQLPQWEPAHGILGLQGIDPRYEANPDMFEREIPQGNYATRLYTGNLLVPHGIFEELAGYDEGMIGFGEDCEFGIRAQLSGAQTIFSSKVVGYHIYHERDQLKNQQETNRNVHYIAQKHDLSALGLYMWKIGDDVGILPVGELPV